MDPKQPPRAFSLSALLRTATSWLRPPAAHAVSRTAPVRRGANGCSPDTLAGVGNPSDRKHWTDYESRNCSCTGSTKTCTLPLAKQRLRSITIAGPAGDTLAFTAFEIDRGTYGRNLSRHFQRDGRPQRWVDIGANLGIFSIALALANPNATGWAFEPNPVTFAHLVSNIAANGLAGRITPVLAGVTRDGRSLSMPRCVVLHRGGSQMASTQWLASSRGGPPISMNRCFSSSCSRKVEQVRAPLAPAGSL